VSLKENSILCVGASDVYSEDDYIRDYNKYLEWVEENYEKDTV
ncbi:WxcM-like domain-containing protein, partial [Cetobacterium sp.]